MSGMRRTEYGYVSRTEEAIIEQLTREEQRAQAIIYTRPGCQKCRHTILKLKQVMTVQTITADADDYERFRKLGYRSMPVVKIYKEDGTHDDWCGLQADKIRQYTEG